MSYEPLHHKYRPQTFNNLVGQSAIAQTLINAIKQEKIAPAYLFTGPRGTGKTSSARILAKSLNCLTSKQPTPTPCGQCEVCQAIALGTALDVIEIDAASNTGVDNIREIIDRSQFAPVQSRYKVYVIDECHMLSTAAFNALLKTLEEPPPRVVFILATTDPQRVLPTIISRCQRFDYRRIPLKDMVKHLTYIAQQEKIQIDLAAIKLVGQIANGGLRDAESLLDQLSLFPDPITTSEIWDLVGAIPEQDLLILLQQIRQQNLAGVLQQCRSLLDRGREPITILQNLASFYLNLLIAKSAPQSSELVAVTEDCWQKLQQEAAYWQQATILWGQQKLKEAESQIKHTTQPRLWLEVTLLGLFAENSPGTITKTPFIGQEHFTNATHQTSKPEKSAPVSPETKVEQTITSETISECGIVSSANTRKVQDTSPSENATVSDIVEAPTESFSEVESIAIDESVTSAAVEPSSETPVAHSQADNEVIWQKAIAILEPPTTRSLLSQKCHLMVLEGTTVTIGISSPPLLRLLQGKITNIETAFSRVCQRKIKVNLEIATDATIAVTQVPTSLAPEPQKIASQPSTTTNPNSEKDLEVTPAKKPDSNGFQREKTTLTTTNPISPNELSSEIASNSDRHNLVNSEVEFTKVVELIAKSFDGEIVTSDDYASSEATPETQSQVAEVSDSLSSETIASSNTSIPKQTSHQSIVANRPDPSIYDEEDIPFFRPINLEIGKLELQDFWEWSLNYSEKWLERKNYWF